MKVIKNKYYVIGSDYAGYQLKEAIKALLEEEGLAYEDVGVSSEDDDTYYSVIAKKVVEKIMESGYKKEGILICGTGIGMAITANKFPGIYAAACYDTYASERARLSNDTNIITIGSRILGPVLAKKIIKIWLSLEFRNGSSTPKLAKIKEYEKENLKD